jgi:ATP-dependent HslUV protease ATP-binding subunit HslU
VEEISFTAADRSGDAVVIDAADVKRLVGDLARDADPSRFIL